MDRVCWCLRVCWRGDAYVGWQRQPNGASLQELFEGAVSRALGGEPVRVTATGRTDAGVHALAQLISFRAETPRAPAALVAAINQALPRDVAALEAWVAPPDLDVRRWVRRKLYRYRVLNRPVRCPFREGQAWHWRGPLAIAAMDAAARHLEGRHDFSSFRAQGCGAAHPVRLIERARVLAADDEVHLEFTGNGFLRHQVRIMTGTLMEVGQGRRDPQDLARLLVERRRERAGRTAPAHGLWLVSVELGDGPRAEAEGDEEDE